MAYSPRDIYSIDDLLTEPSNAAAESFRKNLASSPSYVSTSSKTKTARTSSATGKCSASSQLPSSPTEIPRSVRNSRPEMRALIRRKQNKESSRRNRVRKNAEREEHKAQLKRGQKKIKELEKKVMELESNLQENRNYMVKTSPKSEYRKSGDLKLCHLPGEYFEPDQPFFGDAF